MRKLASLASLIVSIIFLQMVCANLYAANSLSARPNDIASKYVLEDSGKFYRIVQDQKCFITGHVVDFKIATHAEDPAVVYLVRLEQSINNKSSANLYLLTNSKEVESGARCPKFINKLVAADVKADHNEYSYELVRINQTAIVSLALNQQGILSARNSSQEVLSIAAVDSFEYNPCFLEDGFHLNEYLAFVLRFDGSVIKLKGDHPEESLALNDIKYSSLLEFNEKNNLCKK